MKKILISALAAVALLAGGVVTAEAKPSKTGKASKGKASKGKASKGKAKRCAKTQKVGFVVKGTFGSSDGATITVADARGNKHARNWLAANDASFSLDAVSLSFEGVTDADADGDVDLHDVQATDEVRVIGKLSQPKKRCAGESTLTVRKIKVVRETPDVADDVTEQPQGETEQPQPVA